MCWGLQFSVLLSFAGCPQDKVLCCWQGVLQEEAAGGERSKAASMVYDTTVIDLSLHAQSESDLYSLLIYIAWFTDPPSVPPPPAVYKAHTIMQVSKLA